MEARNTSESPISLRFTINKLEGTEYVRPDQIVWMCADGGYTMIFCVGGKNHLICKGLGELEKQLPNALFFRCHHAHVVNLERVMKTLRIGGYRVLMDSGATVEVARRRWKLLKRTMEQVQ